MVMQGRICADGNHASRAADGGWCPDEAGLRQSGHRPKTLQGAIHRFWPTFLRTPMIELIEHLPAGSLGFSCSGQISGEEMQRLVIPSVETALQEYEQIKALVVIEPDFQGLSLEAAWDDTNLSLRHWDGFERLAVVSDISWVKRACRALALLLPYPVQIFALSDQDGARRWLSEALGTVHFERQGEVITITLIGLLDQEVYARIDDDLANVFSQVERPRVLLDLRQFDGWLALDALRQHLALIRDYRHRPQKLAVVSNGPLQQIAQRLIKSFSQADSQTFGSNDLLAAQEWICLD